MMATQLKQESPSKRKVSISNSNEQVKTKKRRGGRRNKKSCDNGSVPIPPNSNVVPSLIPNNQFPPNTKHCDQPNTSHQSIVENQCIDGSTKTLHHLSSTAFANLNISDHSKRAIAEELQYEYLTHVQNETFQIILDGKDVLAKAKTGNGKTMAFLLPVIEHIVRDGRFPNSIPVLVISPTRELAQQIASEATRLTIFHQLRIACFVGGTSIKTDNRILNNDTPLDLLIATPGRLIDHLGQDTGGIQSKLSNLRVLVLDEADRLLDMGFRPELLKIIQYLPTDRQTLLFSATLPASTDDLKRVALKEDYAFVDTIDENDHQTNVQTTQQFLVCPLNDVITVVEYVLSKHIKERTRDYKVMVFFPTARSAQFMAQLFVAAGFKGVLEMHSRKSQSARTKTADKFRLNKCVMMFSSDVSARGVDYPDVSLVLQVGLTDRDQYIHRLGRTARAGSAGQGMLVLSEFEKCLLQELKDLPLVEFKIPGDIQDTYIRTKQAILSLNRDSELEKSAQQSYQAWLGFYNGHIRRLKLTKERLVQLAAEYSYLVGLKEVPKLEKKTLRKMNLFGVTGLEAAPFDRDGNRGGYTGSHRDRGRGRGYGGRGGTS